MLLPRLLRTRCAQSLARPLASSLPIQSRAFSTQLTLPQQLALDDDPISKLPNIDPSQLNVTETITPKQLVPNQDLIFGRTFTGESTSYLHLTYPLTPNSIRSHAFHRMDSFSRLASSSNNALPEPLPRPCHLRLPLCIRMLRRHESIQMHRRLPTALPTR